MPPRRDISLRNQKAANARWHPDPIVIDPVQFAFSVLVEGAQPEKALRMLEWNNIVCPNHEKIYDAIRMIGDKIIDLAEKSMEHERANLPPDCVISFDGSWNHRRRGTHCLFSVICRQTGKVIESITVSNKIETTALNYCEHSNLMEAHGLKLAIERLKNLPQIMGYVHDNDAKARKIIEESGWGITEFLDPGHALKCFERRLQKFKRENPEVLKGIEGSLTKWIRSLIRYDGTTDEKVNLWMNSVSHYSGDHSRCLHGNRPCKMWDKAGDPVAIEALKKFLESTKFIIEYCNTEFDTQSNESLHKLKLKYATKDVKWGNSWRARMMCAVLDRNMVNWKLFLYDQLGLPPLAEEVRIRVQQAEDRRIAWKIYIHTDLYKERQYLQRKQGRKETKRICAYLRQFAYGIHHQNE